MKIQPKNVVITVCIVVITPFVWSVLFSYNGVQACLIFAFVMVVSLKQRPHPLKHHSQTTARVLASQAERSI